MGAELIIMGVSAAISGYSAYKANQKAKGMQAMSEEICELVQVLLIGK